MSPQITERNFSDINALTTEKNVEHYLSIMPCIEMARAISRINYQSIYIFDYFKNNFLYLSDNPLFLCGKNKDLVQRMGFKFFIWHVPQEDLLLLEKINKAGFAFFNKLSTDEKFQHSISYNFHLKHYKNKMTLVNHKMTPLKLDSQNKIWLALGIVSMASESVTGRAEIRKIGTSLLYELNTQTEQWVLKEDIVLTPQEKEILMLSVQGLTNKDISRKIHLTEATIKFHKSKIFKKAGVNNIAEAIGYLTNYIKL